MSRTLENHAFFLRGSCRYVLNLGILLSSSGQPTGYLTMFVSPRLRKADQHLELRPPWSCFTRTLITIWTTPFTPKHFLDLAFQPGPLSGKQGSLGKVESIKCVSKNIFRTIFLSFDHHHLNIESKT